MRIVERLGLVVFGLSLAASLRADPGPMVLWYTNAAVTWQQEALPVGNGKLAAMVFGGVASDQIQFNEDTIWTGQPHYYENTNMTPDHLAGIRNMVFNGQDILSEASSCLLSVPVRQAMYEPPGSLMLTFPHSGATNYLRSLDLNTATASVRYDYDGVTYYRDVFASAPSNKVIVIRLTASQTGKIAFTGSFTTPQTGTFSTVGTDLVMSAWVSVIPRPEYYATGLTNAIRYEARVRVIAEGGTVTAEGSSISVTNADTVTLLLGVASNFVNYHDLSADCSGICSNNIVAAAAMTYNDLRRAQTNDYQALFRRVVLDLGSTAKTNLPTGARLKHVDEGDDPQLSTLYFQMGRYLMISGSRPGSQPLTLQGKWNDYYNPSWESKMTVNINEEMNYWGAEVCNLSECHLPLFDLIADLSATGHRVAGTNYYADGWVVHHNTDLWRGAAPINSTDGVWPTGGAWLCQHLWWHYEYTRDTNFLANTAYPLMKSAARFFVDFLIPHQNYPDWLVTNPSFSPEHNHPLYGVRNVAGPTMDNQLIRDLFNHTIQAGEILGVDYSFRTNVAAIRDRLPPNLIGSSGQLQEWLEDVDMYSDLGHRHMSHLVALFPGDEITPFYTPVVAQAARVSVDYRGDGSGSTGWDKSWRMCLRDRLMDGDHAYLLFAKLLKSYASTNLMFTDVNNRQIDGIFGALAGITELFLQNNSGEIFLLPALPSKYTNGLVSGLCARGGFEVDNMTWTNGRLAGATILSRLGNPCRLRTKCPIDVKLGSNYVNAPMVLPGLYQFSTVAGSNYTILPAHVAETENLSATISPGATHQVTTNAAFSNLRGTLLTATATNAYVTYVVSNLTAGTYNVYIGADAGADRGKFQLAGGPAGGALNNVGPVEDTCSATNMAYLLPINLYTPTNLIILWTNLLKEFNCGTWTAPSNGNYSFRFTVVDKNAGSRGFNLALDYIKLTPATIPTLTVVRQDVNLVLSWPASVTGYSLESITNLMSTNWTPVSPAPVVVGDYNVVTNTIAGEKMFYRLLKP